MTTFADHVRDAIADLLDRPTPPVIRRAGVLTLQLVALNLLGVPEMALALAARLGAIAPARVLMKVAEIDQPNGHGITPLMYAASNGHDPIVHDLLDAGADIRRRSKHGRTPLFFAAENGYDYTIQLLLDCGAGVSDIDIDGKTPLMLAAAGGHDEVVYKLLGAGVSPIAHDRSGMSALCMAAEGGHVHSARALLNHGASRLDHCGGGQSVYDLSTGGVREILQPVTVGLAPWP